MGQENGGEEIVCRRESTVWTTKLSFIVVNEAARNVHGPFSPSQENEPKGDEKGFIPWNQPRLLKKDSSPLRLSVEGRRVCCRMYENHLS